MKLFTCKKKWNHLKIKKVTKIQPTKKLNTPHRNFLNFCYSYNIKFTLNQVYSFLINTNGKKKRSKFNSPYIIFLIIIKSHTLDLQYAHSNRIIKIYIYAYPLIIQYWLLYIHACMHAFTNITIVMVYTLLLKELEKKYIS